MGIPSAEGAAGVVRQLGRSPAMEGLAMSVDTSASVAVAWARLSMGSQELHFEPRRTAVCGRAHAHDGAVGTVRSRSW